VSDLRTLERLVARAKVLAAAVCDPEIPVLSLADLGVLRDVRAVPHGAGWVVEIVITPTYSGCPALDTMRDDILAEMDAEDIPARIRTQLAPAWTTDWMSSDGRAKLRAYGIAPPHTRAAHSLQLHRRLGDPARENALLLIAREQGFMRTLDGKSPKNDLRSVLSTPVHCPQCDSPDTVELNYFGSTACKSQYRCLSCKEPFDLFKPH
jgi:ring-1,2-phenylacetyl-CoA epoxidase subunit PaaD